MWRSREAWTEEYATVAGVGFVMRAKTAPGGRLTRETEREVKAPGLRSTWRRRERSGLTQAGICEVTVEEGVMTGLVDDFPFVWGVVAGGGVEVTAAGDMADDEESRFVIMNLCVWDENYELIYFVSHVKRGYMAAL
jgi:hypothetical protein